MRGRDRIRGTIIALRSLNKATTQRCTAVGHEARRSRQPAGQGANAEGSTANALPDDLHFVLGGFVLVGFVFWSLPGFVPAPFPVPFGVVVTVSVTTGAVVVGCVGD